MSTPAHRSPALSAPIASQEAPADLREAAEAQRALVRAAYPEIYAVVPRGDCMSPLYEDGVPIIVSSTAVCGAGDVVIVHMKPEFVKPGGFEAIVKRLTHDLYGTTFPWDPTGSDVIIPVTLEQLNPPRRHYIPYDRIAAIHKVIGKGEHSSDGQVTAPRSLVEAA